jgi:hypothetical protein
MNRLSINNNLKFNDLGDRFKKYGQTAIKSAINADLTRSQEGGYLDKNMVVKAKKL